MEPVEIGNAATTSNSESLGRSVHIRGVPLDDVMQAFLRRNVSYYRPIFLGMEREGTKFHANFVALFFTPVWLAYRRFYIALVVLYAAPVAAVLTKSLFSLLVASPWPVPQLLLLGPFIASVVFYAFGNFFIYRRFRRLIADPSIPAEQLLARVQNRGGGSAVVLWAAIAVTGILFVGYPLSVIVSAVANPPGALR